MPKILHSDAADFSVALSVCVAAKREAGRDVAADVAAIIRMLRDHGDSALIDLTRRFDRFDLDARTLRIAPAEVAAARRQCSAEVLAALELAARRIESFHRRSLPTDFRYVDGSGVTLGARWSPVDAVGLYVPGGMAAYPSSVLMNAVPAKVAGVGRVAMCVPTPDGKINPAVLAAAEIAGVHEIYRVGGAQAVAALAYGTASIAPVDKITGPGNAYVAEAKRQVFGVVGIDMIAGPSEILVIADGANDPAHIAADLLSQAEHDTAAQAILLTPDKALAAKVSDAIDAQLRDLLRRDVAMASWRDWGIVIVTRDLAEAADLANRFAPEHIELCVDDPDALLPAIRHAGSIFLGRHTPEAIGDYVAGTNHVLPTSRTARFASGLNVTDFMKRSTLIGCTPAALRAIGPAAVTLAEAEGLTAHANSVARRLASGGHS
ncbi:MAG: histidinol dehydrogenase [Alphaproteobacteria bacterium]